MRKMASMLLVALSASMARGEATTPNSPAGIAASFVREVSALATNHAELAHFPKYAMRLDAHSSVEFSNELIPFAGSKNETVTPVVTKRRIRPSDCGTNGIYLQFVLDDGTNERQAPTDTVTHYPHLKLTLYANVVLWEKATPELTKKLDDLVARHKAMLTDLDKRAASLIPKAGDATVEDPQHGR
jgi:hypothetical protein